MRNLKLKNLKFFKGKYELFNDRYVFIPPQIINVLSSIYGEGVKSLLVWLGKKAGWTMIQKWEENYKPKTLQDLVNQFIGLINNFGWGKLISTQVSEDLIEIEFHHNISSKLENNSKYFCYFINGILSGFGEFALYKSSVIETQCSIDEEGVNYCVYEVKKVN